MEKILVIGGWKRLYQQIESAGFEVGAVAPSECEGFNVCVFPDMGFEEINRYCEANSGTFDKLVCYEEALLELASKIAEVHSIPSNSLEAVEVTIDKMKMRQRLSDLEVNPSYSGVNQITNVFQYPVILKPRKGTASLGVREVSYEELLSFEVSDMSDYMLEEKLSGDEISIECISRNGEHRVLGITKKELFTHTFVEKSHFFPFKIDHEVQEKLHETVKQVLTRLGVTNGPSHTEFMINGDDFKVIETHTRSGGDYIYDLILLSTGINVFTDWMTEEGFNKESLGKSSYVRFFAPGEVKNVCVDLNNFSTLIKYSVEDKDSFKLRSSADRCGYALCSGSTFNEMESQVKAMISRKNHVR